MAYPGIRPRLAALAQWSPNGSDLSRTRPSTSSGRPLDGTRRDGAGGSSLPWFDFGQRRAARSASGSFHRVRSPPTSGGPRRGSPSAIDPSPVPRLPGDQRGRAAHPPRLPGRSTLDLPPAHACAHPRSRQARRPDRRRRVDASSRSSRLESRDRSRPTSATRWRSGTGPDGGSLPAPGGLAYACARRWCAVVPAHRRTVGGTIAWLGRKPDARGIAIGDVEASQSRRLSVPRGPERCG